MPQDTLEKKSLVRKVDNRLHYLKKSPPKTVTFPGKPSVSFESELSSKLLSGFGLYRDHEDVVRVSIEGTESKESSIVSISPLISSFKAAPGLSVLGRVKAIRGKRWLIDIGGSVDAVLNISSVSLPKSEQRRKSKEETYNIRQFFKEDQVLFLEVASAKSGTVNLLMRSAHHGILKNGVLIKVPSNTVGRSNNSVLDVDGIRVIIGMNGFIWVSGEPTDSVRDCVTDNTPEVLNEAQIEAFIKMQSVIKSLAEQKENNTITDQLLLKKYLNKED